MSEPIEIPTGKPVEPNYFWAFVQSSATIVLFVCGGWFGALIEREAMWQQAADRGYAYQERWSGKWRWVDLDPWPGAGMPGKEQPTGPQE